LIGTQTDLPAKSSSHFNDRNFNVGNRGLFKLVIRDARPPFRIDHALPFDDYLAVHTAIMIPTAVPSAIAIVVTTDNHRSAFAVTSPEPAIMVAVADP
jgi:hypothetical protein